MSDPLRPPADTDEEDGPFPARYGTVGQSADSPNDPSGPTSKEGRPGRLGRTGEQGSFRRQRHTEASGPVPAVAGAGTGSATLPVGRGAGADVPTSSTRTVADPPRRSPGLRPAPPRPEGDEVVTEPAGRRSDPNYVVPDTVARQVGREYAPDAEVIVGRHHWWQLRRKVTVVRGRSSRRLVRRIDTWSVFKISFIFYVLSFLIIMIAGLITWRVAVQVGFVTDIQKAVRSLADDRKFVLHGDVVFKYSLIGGAAMTIVLTLLNVVASMLYNLISDIFGGIQVIVVSEPD
jgi:Transmembrane domain of unknown function (DUF3566)